ncbi:MAG: hypothetical protein K5696_08500 [Lachnospiraceae bacterium]|nr:hypothetical protein [Lachnospiraceae bacterium]
MRDKTPMEYIMDFLLNILDVLYKAASKIGAAGYEAWKARREEDKKNEMVDANKREQKKYPPEIGKKLSKDNMDISVEDFEKLSRKEKKQYRQEWNSISEAERTKRRNEFSKKQMPILTKAINDYYAEKLQNNAEVTKHFAQDNMDISRETFEHLSKDAQKAYKAEWNKLSADEQDLRREQFSKTSQPKIDEAVKKNAPQVYAKLNQELGPVSLFTNVEQRVPKRVADEMAMEFPVPGTGQTQPMPYSRKDWVKMSQAEQRKAIVRWNKLTPEKRQEQLRAFEAEAKQKIEEAWVDFEASTGKKPEVPVGAFSHDSQSYINSVDQMIAQQKKQSVNERQKEELTNQKNDGKQAVEEENKELENSKARNNQETREDEHTVNHEAPQTENQTQNTAQPPRQSFGGRRNEHNGMNQQLNESVNALQQSKPEQPKKEETATEIRQNKEPEQKKENDPIQSISDQFGVKPEELDENYEKNRELIQKGAQERKEKAKEEVQMKQSQPDLKNGNSAMNNDRPILPGSGVFAGKK